MAIRNPTTILSHVVVPVVLLRHRRTTMVVLMLLLLLLCCAPTSATAFPKELYHAQQEPFRNYPCYPHGIHISQSSNYYNTNNNNKSSSVINMTVSFLLDYYNCATAIPIVYYGKVDHTGEKKTLMGQITGHEPLQFNYTSHETNGTIFQSDWIYHLVIPYLRGGGLDESFYWYHIIVMPKSTAVSARKKMSNSHDDDDDAYCITTTSSDAHDDSSSSSRDNPKKKKSCPDLQHYSNNRMHNDDSVVVDSGAGRRSLRGSMGYSLGETRPYNFRTPPMPGSPTSLALVGDLGQTHHSAKTLWDIYLAAAQPSQAATTMTTEGDDESPPIILPPVSQLLIAGDLSYANTDPTRWTRWLRFVEPLTRTLPLMVAAGNHEIECDIKTYDIFPFYERYFSNPNRITAAVTEPVDPEYRRTQLWNGSCAAPSQFRGVYDYGNSFYSYQHGLAHIIVLNSYTDTSVGSPQYRWLHAELVRYSQLPRTPNHPHPWLLVAFHAPFYTTFLGHVNESEALNMRQSMEPLLVRYGVNLVISGHDHAYLRTHPLAFGERQEDTAAAPVYLTLGAGGNQEGHARGYQDPDHPEPWVAARNLQEYGFGHLFLANTTHARFRWVRNDDDRMTDNSSDDDDSDNDDFEDLVWLTNPHVVTTVVDSSEQSSSFL